MTNRQIAEMVFSLIVLYLLLYATQRISSILQRGPSINEAYRKIGVQIRDLDFEAIGIDIGAISRDMQIRPRKTFLGYPTVVGPKDLLRAMGYTAEGHHLPEPKWNPGEREDNFPKWVKPDGVAAPRCDHDIKYVYVTGNTVTPYVGFDRWEDTGQCIRFYFPYVYIKQEGKWFRLTGGTPSGETGVFSIKHICCLLRLAYEDETMKYKFGWVRRYPPKAHEALGQVYYRGLQTHAPAWVEYYRPGRSYNDVESFDVRKTEFSPLELERKKKAEQRDRMTKAAKAKVADLERRTILEEYAHSVAAENTEFRRKLHAEEVAEREKEMVRAMQEAQMRGAMSKALEKARVLNDST